MRLYTFINYYLSSIQQGIQTAHIVGELFNQVHQLTTPYKAKMICDWSMKHKTILTCNGGNSASIRDLESLFASNQNPYPYARFNEDEDSLDGALTGVGIVLPEEIYGAVYDKDYDAYIYFNWDGIQVKVYNSDTFEYNLIKTIKSAPLAR